MAARATVGWLVVAVLVGTPTALLSRPAQPGLAGVMSELHLSGPGVQDWLRRLGVAKGQPVHERLLAVTSTGEVLRALDGNKTSVTVTPEFDGDLVREGAGLVLVHNHPANTSLSLTDLRHLEKAGVVAIVAIGHDGSVYAAAKPQRPARRHCGPECYAAAQAEVDRALWIELPGMATSASTAASFSTHLTMLALAKAGCVDYIAVMSPERRAIVDAYVVAFGRVVASARAVAEK